jgi:hypothetical protein
MLRFVSSLLVSAMLVFLGTALLGTTVTPSTPKIIATVVAHAHTRSAWIATTPQGL